MTFKLGDYVKHVDYPQSIVILKLTSQMHVDVINAQPENFKHATKEEHDAYWGESDGTRN